MLALYGTSLGSRQPMYIFRGRSGAVINGYCRVPRGSLIKVQRTQSLSLEVFTTDVRWQSHNVWYMRTTLQRHALTKKSCTYSSGTTSNTVPVGNRVAEALTNGDTPVSHTGDGLEHVLGQVVGSLLVDVVLNVEESGTCLNRRAALGDVSKEPILGVLDQVGAVLVVIVGVNVEVDDVVTEVSHVSLALTSAAGVRWAHVGGDLANNVAESHLVLPHLLLAVNLGNGTEVQVGPGVGSKLVTLGVHTLEDTGEFRSDVDLALVDVVTSDEESGLSVVLLHQVEDVRSEDLLWAIIVGQSNRTRCDTAVDAVASILN
jgi:hypothetical protein